MQTQEAEIRKATPATGNGDGVEETKAEKFVELAEQRMEGALKYLRLIGNLSSRAAYDYSNAQVEQLFEALEEALEAARDRFRDHRGPRTFHFKRTVGEL